MRAEAICIIPAVKTSLITEFWESGVPTSFAIQFERVREDSSFVAYVFIKLLVANCSVEGCECFCNSYFLLFCDIYVACNSRLLASNCDTSEDVVALLCRLEKVYLKALEFRRDGRSRNPKFGSLPKPLQKRTVWRSLWALFCVLWGGVRKGSNVWKCWFKQIQFHRLEMLA